VCVCVMVVLVYVCVVVSESMVYGFVGIFVLSIL